MLKAREGWNWVFPFLSDKTVSLEGKPSLMGSLCLLEAGRGFSVIHLVNPVGFLEVKLTKGAPLRLDL